MANGAELGKAYVQIIPSAEGISGKISSVLGGEMTSAGRTAGTSLGSSLVKALGTAMAAAGIGTIIKNSLDAGGELQQNLGGTEAVFGKFADNVKEKATDAYKNMGLSASDYMATVNKMGSLFQGSGISQQKSLEMSSEAMQRAADVASVMGIDMSMAMESIAGAAKGNFTMMDNLGVAMNATTLEAYALEKGLNFKWNLASNAEKSELAMKMFMERTAQYAGNFARESEETFTGSLGAMKAAFQDLLGNLSLGNDIQAPLQNLLTTTQTFFTANFLPMIGNLFSGLPMVISEGLIPALSQAFNMAIAGLNFAAENADLIVTKGLELVGTLGMAIIQAAPALANAAVNIALAFGNALLSYDWASFGTQFLTTLQGMIPAESATAIMQPIYDGITAALPGLLETGVQIITNLANGILANLPTLMLTAGELLIQFADFLLQNMPTILNAAADIVVNLAQGIVNNLPQIITTAATLMLKFHTTIIANLPQILAAGVQIIIKLIAGIKQTVVQLYTVAASTCKGIASSFLKFDWIGLGKNIMNGIVQGVKAVGNTLITTILSMCQNALSAVKSFFGIASPSKVMAKEVGRYIPEGIAVGIENNAGVVDDAVKSMVADATDTSVLSEVSFGTASFKTSTEDSKVLARMDAMLTLMSRYFPEMATNSGEISIASINRQLGAAYQ